MATEVKIPAMGESISSGVLSKWHVADGDFVEKEQLLFELETDKITSEGLAEVSGKISLKANEGDEVAIGQVVAVIDETATKASGSNAPTSAPVAAVQSESKEESRDIPLSPAVRRIVAETGIDPTSVEGTGKDGRVTKGDLLKAEESAPAQPTPQVAKEAAASQPAPAPVSNDNRTTRRRMSPLRKRIAERLVAATQEAALLTTFNEVDMSRVMDIRKRYQDEFVKRHGVKLGFMSFFVKAVVQALKAVPQVNAQIEGDEIVENHYYDIGVAVGTDKGLMVPVVRDCDQKSFAEIEQSILDYAQAARAGKIKIEDLQGGVFTISNGGIYGSMLSTPIVNSPQSAILGLHNITERAVVVDGQIVARPMMYLALSYDHRLIDGKEAVTFLVKIKQAIEDPARLLFDI